MYDEMSNYEINKGEIKMSFKKRASKVLALTLIGVSVATQY